MKRQDFENALRWLVTFSCLVALLISHDAIFAVGFGLSLIAQIAHHVLSKLGEDHLARIDSDIKAIKDRLDTLTLKSGVYRSK